MSKRSGLFSFFRRDDDDEEERYDDDVSFKMSKEDLFEGIKEGSIITLSEKHYLQPDDFLEKDENGKTLLELVFEKNVTLSEPLRKRILNDTSIVEECLKHDRSILLYENFNNVYLDSAVEAKTVFVPLSDGLTLMDYIIKKGLADLYVINAIKDSRVLDYILKYNRNDLIHFINEDVLFKPYRNYLTMFEYLLNKNLVDVFMVSLIKRHDEVVKLCIDYNRPCLLAHLKQEYMFLKVGNRLKPIEYLIKGNNADRDTFFIIGHEKSDEIINMILEHKAYRYLVYYPEILFNRYGNKLYLDLMLENYNKSMDLYLADIKISNLSFKQKAILYLKCSDYGLVAFLPPITIDMLLEKAEGQTFIGLLLSIDKEKTVKKLLNNKMYRNSDLATILRLHGVYIKGVDIPTDKKDKGLKKKNKYLNAEVSEGIQVKLDILRDLFLADGKTSEGEVNLLIASYKRLAKFNYIYLNKELDVLISTKKKHPDFRIVRVSSKPYFSAPTKEIKVNDSSITAFNHELGHAFHHFETYFNMPNGLDDVIKRIHSDPNSLTRVSKFAKFFKRIEEKALAEAEKIYETEYKHYFDTQRSSKIKRLLEEDKKDKLEKFKKFHINEKLLNDDIDNLYDCSEEEYESRFRKIKIEEIKTNLLYEKYSAYAAMSDMLDAIYNGRLKAGVLKDKDGQKIELLFGHGIDYYNVPHNIFNELIADYVEIIKEKDGEEALSFLRYVVGNEIVDLIEYYYEKNILHFEPQALPIEERVSHGK